MHMIRLSSVSYIVIFAFSLALSVDMAAQRTAFSHDFRIMEYNVENLFDCLHDSLKDDLAFTPEGSYRWTHGRYWTKLNRVARGIVLASTHGDELVLPDIIALCEVENDSVTFDLAHRSLLRTVGYEYIVTRSLDVRGIDVALLYQPFAFRPLRHYPLRTRPLPGMRPTRDILYVCGETLGGEVHVFVVHAPSRYGGERASRPHRLAVARRLFESLDSLTAISPEARVVVAGDFNDYSGDASLAFLAGRGLTDVSAPPSFRPSGLVLGTYRYQGHWGSLDHILVSRSMLRGFLHAEIASHPDLLEADEKYGGVKPYRFFRGPVVHGGYSDHLPLSALFRF